MSSDVTRDDIQDETLSKLDNYVNRLSELAEELGLSPYEVNYWIVSQDDINKLSAYQGFSERYPHWRWGMKYLKQKKQSMYLGGKIFELVNHDNPSNAFLQESNNLVDQKSVIAHVEAHADFFANNNWFDSKPDASDKFSKHADVIQSYYDDPNLSRSEVESWIDAIICIEDTASQNPIHSIGETEEGPQFEEKLEELDVSDEIQRTVTSDDDSSDKTRTSTQRNDILGFLIENGKQYDEEEKKAVEYEEWQKNSIQMLREEALYFQPQKVTKIMNEGWAAYWEDIMMVHEAVADVDEFVDFADKQSKVYNSPGLNPYKLGKEIWEYIENVTNRQEVIDKLLRVKGITWKNFHSELNFSQIQAQLEQYRDSDDICEKHYSLLRPQNTGFIKSMSREELKKESRYMIDKNLFDTVEEAISEIDYAKGWERMRQIRETHNDITFIDTFLSDEFITNNKYFTYDFDGDTPKVSSTELDEVKRKILLDITNGGKPTIVAADKNFNNSGELLLKHKYNGVEIDREEALDTLTKIFELWGRPVYLKTIKRDENNELQGVMLSFDGESQTESNINDGIDDIRYDEVSYNTKPDDW
jgi:stage V sporulation protein R